MKTLKELNALKEEVEPLNKKLAELNEDELKQINGGFIPPLPRADWNCQETQGQKMNIDTDLALVLCLAKQALNSGKNAAHHSKIH